MSVLKRLARFTRDLLSYDEQLIRLGRDNWEREDFARPYIVVDALVDSQRLATSQAYDRDAEVQTYADTWRTPCTISFFGAGADERARLFSVLVRSQRSAELQVEHGVSVFPPTSITNVKALTGQQYGENVELGLTVVHGESVDVDTLRIDTPHFAPVEVDRR